MIATVQLYRLIIYHAANSTAQSGMDAFMNIRFEEVE